MFITAESLGGVAKQGVVGYGDVPDTRSLVPIWDGQGILTGARRLACVNLARADRKVRTKPLCLRDFSRVYLDIFRVMLWS